MKNGVQQIKDKLLAMAVLAEDMVDRAVHALLEGNDATARQVREDDDQLDRLEQEVDELAVNLLAAAKETQDLRAITVGLKISNDLERIGDEAGTIAKRVLALNHRGGWDPPLKEEITAMGERACTLLRECVDSYVANDAGKARQLIPQDDELDLLNRSYQKKIVEMMQADPSGIPGYLELGEIVKRLERIADHAINIAEGVVFIEDAPPRCE